MFTVILKLKIVSDEPTTFGNRHMGVCQNYGYIFGCPHNKDDNIWGSFLGSPYLGKLPFWAENSPILGSIASKLKP